MICLASISRSIAGRDPARCFRRYSLACAAAGISPRGEGARDRGKCQCLHDFFAPSSVLHRYTGQEDFLVTSPSANRQRREFEFLIGPFVNPLLLRADLHGTPTFRELLGRVRGAALEAFSNQDIPFEMLLDEFQAPQLQVNFHYDSGLHQAVNLPDGLTLELLPSLSVGTVYELSVSVLESADNVRLELEYTTHHFLMPKPSTACWDIIRRSWKVRSALPRHRFPRCPC